MSGGHCSLARRALITPENAQGKGEKAMHLEVSQNESLISDALGLGSRISDMEMLGNIVEEIIQSGHSISNKAIIVKLIHKIETEANAVFQEKYRALLELIVYKTQDDFLI
ncbi:biofilm/acid-resistance regulator YmgB/AriR [Pectobacterium brasiliense]|uniref:biofilm/acid-resistance regulator YmgB/AriR n=1 Tax=Pectobacterium brasiliense TaxID=180957 RepID=UPI001F07F788|nr:biofilm/acid-resistance regulator YmgB/AriR [Pectobacterium brasiliense]